MKIKTLIVLLVVESVCGKYVRIIRQTDGVLHNVGTDEDNVGYQNGHCFQEPAKSFTCSEGSFDEILTEVTSQANILKIERISLPSIPDSAMQTFPDLVELSIRESNVSSLTSKSFQGLADLESLDLSSNLINSLNTPYFTQTGALRTFNISSNKINSIGTTALKGLKVLRDLDLSRNLIENIPSSIFSHTPAIVSINLSHNKLSTIPNSLFSSLLNLETLNLANNKISKFQDKSFSSLPALRTLHLQQNGLRSFSAGVFGSPSQELNYISLEFNELQFLDAEQLLRNLPALKTLGIAPNSWDCDCLNYMLDVIDDNNIEYTPREYFEGITPVCIVSKNQKYSNANPCNTGSPINPVTSKPTRTASTTQATSKASSTSSPVTTARATSATPKTTVTTSVPTTKSTTLRYPIPFW